MKKHGTTDLKTKTILDRFMDKVEMIPDCGCWIWMGSLDASGRKSTRRYGTMFYNGKREQAHRVSWEIYNGQIPKHMLVLHRCDTPSCVNPNHLFIGTHLDNMKDCINKNRRVNHIGTLNGHAKLSADDIMKIKMDNRTPKEIAHTYNMSRNHIYKILNGNVWKHLIATRRRRWLGGGAMIAMLIKTDGTEQEVNLPSGRQKYAEIERLIGAACLDSVNLRDGRFMMVDDLGHQQELAPNAKATALYHSVCVPGTTHQIVGDVVVVREEE